MIISSIQIKRLPETETKLKAIADITLDDIVVIHDIKVLEEGEKMFLAMPSKEVKPTGFKDIVHPINSKTREAFERIIFSVYQKSVRDDKTYIDIRMKYEDGDNIFSQTAEEYEIVSTYIGERVSVSSRGGTNEKEIKMRIDTRTNNLNGNDDFECWLRS